MKQPLDQTDYERDPRSRPIRHGIAEGRYVYVLDATDTIWIVPDDRPHLHPRVLGHRLPAEYAGDLTVKDDRIVDLTNCSGTFQFDEEAGLRKVAVLLRAQGWRISPGAVRLFSHRQAMRPIVLE